MRWSRFYLFTTREVPSDAEVVSHRLMMRAGMIQKLAAGIYSYLPFGLRSIAKLKAIVRREMNAAGAVELSMPGVQPAELWQESGRWTEYGSELLRLRDRHDRDFCLGPTHEEVITDIVRRDIKSYRQLPTNLYQIQNKFRDEIRPRFGLMRGREFSMKDAYSFHVDAASLDEQYEVMQATYRRIFESCRLDYTVVEADSGSIGGSSSHEFMVVAETGESAVVRCPDCDYAANVEKAEAGHLAAPATESPVDMTEVATPGASTVEDVAEHLEITPDRVVKTLVYQTEGGLVAALVRGDREINEVKLANLLDVNELRLAGESEVREATGSPVGFSGPVGVPADLRVVSDASVRDLTNFVVGANKADAHFTGVNWGRDLSHGQWSDLLLVREGDPCPNCDGTLEQFRGIEVGHIFKLGDKYSKAMGCVYSDSEGQSHPMEMGCYGLGIGRTVAASIEQNHDDNGIIWPVPLAPFEAIVAPLQMKSEEVVAAAEKIYQELLDQGVDVILDDRNERPGVKFNDADLIGIPVRVVIGARSLAEGQVELSHRRDGEKELVALADIGGRVAELLAG